ncbi:hypothetical protein BDY21DRAFT_279185 [Lineolata rhizophorae]|uniref:Pal1 cell morphology protein-domain-containing protein n=1 Tax=Lineolata rhizophorae TaxID=578093 RepID=A0A6A6P9Z1_9PEZI|nr:hypothetical protein BDY21DRAFT_279185 [Lineolata rhizophorae]
MPIIRNPFRRGVAGDTTAVQDENARPIGTRTPPEGGFQQTKVVGAHPVDIKEPIEYKLSEINDSGVYLPPSPPERRGFWTRSTTSTTSSTHRSVLSEAEPFNMSRESFDSYRRSFDISARSPVMDHADALRPRQSLDSRQARLQPRSSLHEQRRANGGAGVRGPTAEEREADFEDVGLNEEPKQQLPVKKRGLFARFGDSASDVNVNNQGQQQQQQQGADANRPGSSGHHGFHFSGRKRGQSGQGAELKNMNRAGTPVQVGAE